MVKKNYDELAYSMEKVLADEDYQQIFTKPKVKTANTQIQQQVKFSADGITDTFTTLVTLSTILDDMGYSKSSIQLLKAAQEIEDEAKFQPIESEKSQDGDLDDLLRELGQDGSGGPWDIDQDLSRDLPKNLGDTNDTMDKPSKEDDEEGNPEC